MNTQLTTAVLALALVLILCTEATIVRKCSGNDDKQLSDENVNFSNCRKGRCLLWKGTQLFVQINFEPDHDVKNLRSSIAGMIWGITFPFIGVDGTSACDKLYEEDGVTKTKCPLKAGHKYVYKHAVDVLHIYPSIDVDVHWALTEDNDKDLVCFEVPAEITS
ncbi:ecdysteroid-regulated 16 kDa protein-like [Contarinia nasturtii]|uniref:ecdysteroid-regulated 16 kDa protein-like n=1 Tax=Contarinia nasturtii TaxID=265458 RepID=UPI0012D3D135|nr:ecdysteroid-regulated 16 kDa protein-like [Contarinia nasturtii]